MSRVFSFAAQNAVGREAERAFLRMMEGQYVSNNSGKNVTSPDFRHMLSGRLLELKRDTYDCAAGQGNMFAERISNSNKQTDGGPWRAKKEGVALFAVWYVPKTEEMSTQTYTLQEEMLGRRRLYVYETDKLCSFLDERLDTFRKHEIQNRAYITIGYTVPLRDIAHLELPPDSVQLGICCPQSATPLAAAG